MLGWWTDETKGYRLEDLENNKLIASKDVQFLEDETPSELAIMDIEDSHSSPQEVDEFILARLPILPGITVRLLGDVTTFDAPTDTARTFGLFSGALLA